jgi:L-aminopeptidase/D-esterase-like protein
LPPQLARLARRAGLGLGRLGAVSYQSSGDIFIAFGRAEPEPDSRSLQHFAALVNEALDPLLKAVVEATEESVVNALLAAPTMVGLHGNTVYAIPRKRLLDVLRKYHALR